MDPRTLSTAIGAGITTFLVVGAIVVEVVSVDPVAGIVGVLAGAAAGVVAAALVVLRGPPRNAIGRAALAGYAAFGDAFLLLAALSYVDAPGARANLTVPLQVAVGVVAALATAAVALAREGTPPRRVT